jgi:hypothetical protein
MVDMTVHGYAKNTKSFSKQKEKQLQLGIDGPDVQVIRFTCVTEYGTGIKQPCLLVEKHHNKTQQFSLHFLFLVNNSSLVEVASFNLRYSISSLDCTLSDGPSLSWSYRNHIEFLHWNPVSKCLEHTSHNCTNDELYKSWTLLWSGSLNDKCVAMGTVNIEKDKIEWLHVDCKSGLLPGEKTVPSVYSAIALCCYVTDVENTTISSSDYGNIFSSKRDDNTVHQIVYVGTSMGQLIVFVQGKLVSHCQLPFEDPCHIVTMEVIN